MAICEDPTCEFLGGDTHEHLPTIEEVIEDVLVKRHRHGGYERNYKADRLEQYNAFNGSMASLANEIAQAIRKRRTL